MLWIQKNRWLAPFRSQIECHLSVTRRVFFGEYAPDRRRRNLRPAILSENEWNIKPAVQAAVWIEIGRGDRWDGEAPAEPLSLSNQVDKAVRQEPHPPSGRFQLLGNILVDSHAVC